jgi:prepilin-type N-terminal cleavage/methylation domain-containing protein/prepilin-type processing-associated H-X9-DG protein
VSRRGFSLIELVIVVAIIALLLSILLPALASAREHARAAVCGSSIRQLAQANLQYVGENAGRVVPGAPRRSENLRRWHGVRGSASGAFDGACGPLVPHLGADARIRACPSFAQPVSAAGVAFERSAGGYGYNLAYLGRVIERNTPTSNFRVVTDLLGVQLERVRRPAATLMFADAAFAAPASGVIEYSFAEPRFHPEYLRQQARPDPSIHFRHRGGANIAWTDGHVDRQQRTFTWRSGLYEGEPARQQIGWFGATDDNREFDLE